ncbi:MAG: hypothetical protein IJ852_00930 [Alphaproteobacteria bacterium]|nr:hypothetical protein [Alphaproteobacteria bacterium]
MANKEKFCEKNAKKKKGAFKTKKNRTEYQITRDAEKKRKKRKKQREWLAAEEP